MVPSFLSPVFRFDVPIGSAGFTGRSMDGCRLRVPYYRLKKEATNPAMRRMKCARGVRMRACRARLASYSGGCALSRQRSGVAAVVQDRD